MPDPTPPPDLPAASTKAKTAKHLAGRATFTTVPVDELFPDPNQPRKHFDEAKLQELADNLAVNGMGQPITARVDKDGKKYIMLGERRWRAAKLAQWTEVPCIVRTGVADNSTLSLQLAENDLREDVNPMDTARALATYMRQNKIATQAKLAEALGMTLTYVSQHLALLHLSDADQQRIIDGTLGRVEGARLGRQAAGVTRNRAPVVPAAHLAHANPYGIGSSGGRAGTLETSDGTPQALPAPGSTLTPAPTGQGPTKATAGAASPVRTTPKARPSNVIDPDEGPYSVAQWFSEEHPLAARAKGRCRIRHQLRKTVPGGVACAECWEHAIRRDERLHPTE